MLQLNPTRTRHVKHHVTSRNLTSLLNKKMYIARRTTTSDPPAPQPYHAQGATMAVEDPAVLGARGDRASSQSGHKPILDYPTRGHAMNQVSGLRWWCLNTPTPIRLV